MSYCADPMLLFLDKLHNKMTGRVNEEDELDTKQYVSVNNIAHLI